MNSAILTGKISSEIEVINEASPNLFCKFELVLDNRKFECLVAGIKAYKFRYDVEEGMEVTIEALINNQMQLVVQCYETHSYPNYFGQLFDCRGNKLSQEMASF
jgi:uncharacterized protein YdiU (UPF0061 family)